MSRKEALQNFLRTGELNAKSDEPIAGVYNNTYLMDNKKYPIPPDTTQKKNSLPSTRPSPDLIQTMFPKHANKSDKPKKDFVMVAVDEFASLEDYDHALHELLIKLQATCVIKDRNVSDYLKALLNVTL